MEHPVKSKSVVDVLKIFVGMTAPNKYKNAIVSVLLQTVRNVDDEQMRY